MKAQLANALALVGILALSMWGATRQQGADAPGGEVVVAAPMAAAPGELVDARGRTVATGDYQRIVSVNPVADALLLAMVEPGRLLAVSTTTLDQHPEGYRFEGRPGVGRSSDLELVISLQPDLVVASKFADEDFMQRLRDAGIAVFDLGEMRGVATTLDNIDTLGRLLEQPERADRLRADYALRLAALDAVVPDEDEVPGLYLTLYGDSIFGGTAGSSYADMLHYAGVHDLAAEAGFRDWPSFSPEELLAIDPPMVITQAGMAKAICGHSTLRDLAACEPGGRVIEVPGEYHSDAGLGLVHAARQVQRLVHPDRLPPDGRRAPSVQVLGDPPADP